NVFSNTAHTNAPLVARTWVNLPTVVSSDTKSANAMAHEHLMCGADGILFDMSEADPEALMHQIEWPHCYVAFTLRKNAMVANALSDFVSRRFDPAAITGALFWESIPQKSNFDFLINHCKRFRALGVRVLP